MKHKTFNIMTIKRVLLIVFLLITSIYTSSAQCPSNIGFENGDLFQWQSFISNSTACGGIGCCPINACSFQGSNFQIPGRIEITNSTWGTDPYSGLPCVCPVSAPTTNNFSLKLGNDGTGSESERVRIQFPVNTNNSTLIYRYAAVLNNAGHAAADQPRIQFTVFDAGPLSNPFTTPVAVTCPSFNIAAPTSTSNMPPNWFQSPSNAAVFCSNWIPVSVNLAALNGHLVIIEFATGDCSFGGHWGYSYIDIPGGCNPFTISTGYCPGQSSATMYGPPGFSNYSWYSLPGFTFLGSTDSIVVIAPTTNTPYACVVTPPAGIACNDTLIDTLRVAPLPTAYFNTNQVICANSPTQFIDSSYTNFYPAFITSWTWDFGDPTTGNNNYSTLQNPVHTFSGTGSFTIQLIVTSSIACVSDTALFTLVNVTQTAVYPNAGADQFICLNTSTTLNPTPPPVQTPAYTTSWTTNNGLHFGSNGISDTTILNPIVTPTGNTTYFFTINNPITGCSFVDSVHVNIIGVAPDANIIAVKDTICPGASTQLAVSVVPSSCGLASSTCNGTPFSTQIGAGGTNVSTYPTPFSLSYSDGRTQVLIRSSELAALGLSAGQIMGLTFNVTNKASTVPYNNFTIHMGCVTQNQYNSSNFVSGLVQVFTKPTYNSVFGTNTFTFNTPYNWDGISNLIVDFCYDNFNSNSSDLVAQTTTTFASVVYTLQTGAGMSGCGMTTGTVLSTSSDRPSIGVIMCNSSLSTAIYSWSPGATLNSTIINNPNATPTTHTTYTVLVDDGNGCQSTAIKTIIIDSSTAVNAGLNAAICVGSVYTLVPTVAGIGPFNYNWTSNPAGFTSVLPSPIVSPTTTTTYTVNVVGNTGCNVSDNVVVTANPVPTSNFTVNPNPVCSGTNALITFTGTALPTAFFAWNFSGATVISGSGAGPYTVSWPNAGLMNVTLDVSQNGCSSTTTTVPVTVDLTPTASFSVNPNPVCTGSANPATITYTGNATASATYNWNFQGGVVVSGTGQGPYSVYWNSPGLKNVSLTVTNGNCTSTNIVAVNVNLVPTSTFILPSGTCTGQNTAVSYAGNMGAGATYTWNFNGGTVMSGSGQGPYQISWNTSGTKNVTLTVTQNGCTSNITTNTIQVTQTPSPSFTMNSTICAGSLVNINYTGAAGPSAGFAWSITGNTNPVQISGSGPHNLTWQNNTNAIATQTVTLVVTENGCTSNPFPQTVQVVPIPTANFTVSSPTCAFDTARIKYIGNYAIPGATYTWNFANSTSTCYGTNAGPYGVIWNNYGTYNITLTITQNGCVSAPVTNPITILQTPNVILHKDTAVCPGQQASLWASGADSYVWGNGISNTPAAVVFPQVTTTYTVVGTSANGCTGNGLAIVSMIAIPNPDAGADTAIILGNVANIGGLPHVGYAYLWNPSGYVAHPTYLNTTTSPPATTPYILQATDSTGCVGYDTVLVIVTNCSNIFIPTAFSPNGDGHNDLFFISNSKQLTKLNKFEIFNRWGQKVYSASSKFDQGWDGKFNGVDQEVGSYTFFFDVECESGFRIVKEGSVTLVR